MNHAILNKLLTWVDVFYAIELIFWLLGLDLILVPILLILCVAFWVQLENLAFYLIELCLVESEALKFKPSLLCASAIYLARCTLQMTPAWTSLLHKHARYEESQIRHKALKTFMLSSSFFYYIMNFNYACFGCLGTVLR